MPTPIHWNSDYSLGNETLDHQHKAILELCDGLSDCLADPDPDCEKKFHDTFSELMVQARAHFSTEQDLLEKSGHPDI